MAKIDLECAAMLSEVVLNGKIFVDENEVVRRQIPYYTFRHNMDEGFPITSLRNVDFKKVVSLVISTFERNKEDISTLVEFINFSDQSKYTPASQLFAMIRDYNDNGEFGFEYHFSKYAVDTSLANCICYCGLVTLIMQALTNQKAFYLHIDFKAQCILEEKVENIRDILTKNPNSFHPCNVSIPIYLSSENESVEWKIDRLSEEDFTINYY